MNIILKIVLVLFLIIPIHSAANDIPLTIQNGRKLVVSKETLHPDLIKIENLKQKASDNSGSSMNSRKILSHKDEEIFGDLFQINANISINGQTFIVQVDTASSLMAIPMKGCNACPKERNVYDPKTSNTSAVVSCSSGSCLGSGSTYPMCRLKGGNCDFQILYGDGSQVAGEVYSDIVTLSGFSSRARFGANIWETGQFEYPRADGIIGFARSCKRCVPTVFEHIVQEKGIPNIFGMFLDHEGNGVLSLGEVNPKLHDGDILYTPMVITNKTVFYTINTKSFKIGNKTLNPSDLGTVIIDSGSTALSLSSSVYTQFIKYLKTNYCHIPGVCSNPSILQPDHCYRNADQIEKFPNLEFIFEGGVTITIPPRNYIVKTGFSGHEYGYCFLVDKNDIGSSIFGDVFMRGYYIVFDNVLDRIGFAVGKELNLKDVSHLHVARVGGYDTEESAADSLILVKIPSILYVTLLTVIYLVLSLYP